MLGRRILSRRRLALPLRSGVFLGLRLRPAERGCECGDILRDASCLRAGFY